MLRALRPLGLALGLVGGAVAAQGPEFAQQYVQRLGGAIDETHRVVSRFEADATASGATRDGALDRLKANPDGLAARRGEAARSDIARLDSLTGQRRAIDSASGPLGRLAAIARDPDVPLARATYRDYQPAVPTTAEGLIAGLLGFAAAWGGWSALMGLTRRLWPRRRSAAIPA